MAPRFGLRAVRLVSSTAAALDRRHIDQLRASFPAATLFSMYGLTECHRCTYVTPDRLDAKKISVGIAIPNTELWVVDANGKPLWRNAVGELVIRGATGMKGYRTAPDRPGPHG